MFTIESVEKILTYGYLLLLPILGYLWLTPISKIIIRLTVYYKHTEIERNALYNQYRNGVAIDNPLKLLGREKWYLSFFPALLFLYGFLVSPYDATLNWYTLIVNLILLVVFAIIVQSMYYGLINGLHLKKPKKLKSK